MAALRVAGGGDGGAGTSSGVTFLGFNQVLQAPPWAMTLCSGAHWPAAYLLCVGVGHGRTRAASSSASRVASACTTPNPSASASAKVGRTPGLGIHDGGDTCSNAAPRLAPCRPSCACCRLCGQHGGRYWLRGDAGAHKLHCAGGRRPFAEVPASAGDRLGRRQKEGGLRAQVQVGRESREAATGPVRAASVAERLAPAAGLTWVA